MGGKVFMELGFAWDMASRVFIERRLGNAHMHIYSLVYVLQSNVSFALSLSPGQREAKPRDELGVDQLDPVPRCCYGQGTRLGYVSV